MCTEPSFAAFQWMYPGNYQPLQAVASLLTDIIDEPSSNEALISRQVIDKVFSLLNDRSGVVAEQNGHLQPRKLSQTGKQAWTMLSHLRRRAWKSMGVDPAVLWTSARDTSHIFEENHSSVDSRQGGVDLGAVSAGEEDLGQLDAIDMMTTSQTESADNVFAMMLGGDLGEDLFSGEANPFDISEWTR